MRALFPLFVMFCVASAAPAATLVVGPGGAPLDLAQALAQAQDGDVIELLPGRYNGEPMLINKRLTLRGGEGGAQRPVLVADAKNAELRAIWTVRDAEVTVENIEFSGARGRNGSAAGIRLDSGKLTLRRCAFFDNEVGVVTGNNETTELVVEDSEFGRTPQVVGGLFHQLYAGRIHRVSIRGSRFHSGFEGHLIKSRARQTLIAYNLVYDGQDGQSSYEVDLPAGGDAVLIGNIIGQGRGTQNPVVVSYGVEGRTWPRNRLLLSHNTLISDAPLAWYLRAWADRLGAGTEVRAVNNLTVGAGVFTLGAGGRFDGNWPALRSMLDDPAMLAFELRPDTSLRGRVDPPGGLAGDEAVPTAEFVLPIGTRPLAPPATWSPGALQR
ncbi:MAG: hypothetical protein IV093_00655 [Rubrivivax sp.]|nr:hypothetical protein [Rubrivivax sp.]